MKRQLVGKGPLSLAVVAIAAGPYLAACDASTPAYDGALDTVMVCTTQAGNPTRLPDSACDDLGPTGRTAGGGVWRTATLPASPSREFIAECTDEDGYGYECSDYAPDTDAGGVGIPPIGYPIFFPSGPNWGYGPPAVSSLDRAGRGLSTRGGVITRSGAGSAGFDAPRGTGTRITTKAPIARQTSPFVSRGGLGVSSGARGGSSGS